MKQINLDALNSKLFETIEMLQNNSDPNASPNEKIDVEAAKTISDIGSVIVEGYKVKARVLHTLSNTQNPALLSQMAISSGLAPETQLKLEEKK